MTVTLSCLNHLFWATFKYLWWQTDKQTSWQTHPIAEPCFHARTGSFQPVLLRCRVVGDPWPHTVPCCLQFLYSHNNCRVKLEYNYWISSARVNWVVNSHTKLCGLVGMNWNQMCQSVSQPVSQSCLSVILSSQILSNGWHRQLCTPTCTSGV